MFREIMKTIREGMQRYEECPDLNNPEFYFEATRGADGSPAVMPLVALVSRPCYWIKRGGGCTMCGYQLAASLGREPTEENLIKQTESTIETLPPRIYPFITFNSAGSILDPREVNDRVRPILLKMLSDAGYKHFNFESRPEFLLNRRRVAELKKYFKIVSVGVGLESSNDFIRNGIINKGTSLDSYVRAGKVGKELGIQVGAYIQLGKPFLTAREDIEDAVKTANFAFDNGYRFIVCMLLNIQPYTLTHFLWKKGQFKPPSLWRAFEFIKRLPPERRQNVYIKGFDRAMPTPKEFASNCEKCNGKVQDALTLWNLTGDFSNFIEPVDGGRLDCECRGAFLDEMQRDAKEPLEERVKSMQDYVKQELKMLPPE